MASPHVAGAIALLYAADSSMTPSRVDSMLQSGKLTTDIGAAGRDNVFGYGLLNLPKMLENLYADNEADSVTFAYTNKYFLDFENTLTALNVSLKKVGTGNLTVTGLTADSAEGLSYTDNSSNGFGSYALNINRDEIPNGEFSNTIYFNLSDSTSVAVPIFYSVGAIRARTDVGKLSITLYNSEDEGVTGGTLDMLSDGTLPFIATGLANGSYYLVASTEIDDDGFNCQFGELCQYYPDFTSTSSSFTLDGSNRSGFQISILPIFKNGGANAASIGRSSDQRMMSKKVFLGTNNILPLSAESIQQSQVLGEQKVTPHNE
jgi:serine protease